MVRMQQLAGAGWREPGRQSSLRADRRPPFSYAIDVDQLLRAPRVGDHGKYDRSTMRALGIPVIADVPPIVIITPAPREKHPIDAPPRRRAR